MNNQPLNVPASVQNFFKLMDVVIRDREISIQEVSRERLSLKVLCAPHYNVDKETHSLATWTRLCQRQDILDWLYQREIHHKNIDLGQWAVVCRQPLETITKCDFYCLQLAMSERNVEMAKHILALRQTESDIFDILWAPKDIIDQLLPCIRVDCNAFNFFDSPLSIVATRGYVDLVNQWVGDAKESIIFHAFKRAIEAKQTAAILALIPHVTDIEKECVHDGSSALYCAKKNGDSAVVNALLVAGITAYKNEREAGPEFIHVKRKGSLRMDKVKASEALIKVISGDAEPDTLQEHRKALTNKRLKKYYALYLTYVIDDGKKTWKQRAPADKSSGRSCRV